MNLEGTILLGISNGCQFRGKLIKYLKNDCVLIGDSDEQHIVYDYYTIN